MSLKDEIMEAVFLFPGLTDTDLEKRCGRPHQQVNQACRQLAGAGLLTRVPNPDKNNHLGNYPVNFRTMKERPQRQAGPIVEKGGSGRPGSSAALEEDDIKAILSRWLETDGWSVTVAWGKCHGVDIEAVRGTKRWLIEVKGPGSREAMRHNYFLSILGETLQRMEDPDAKYSIAFPDHKTFRGLWERLPVLTKKRTGISMLLVGENGIVIPLD